MRDDMPSDFYGTMNFDSKSPSFQQWLAEMRDKNQFLEKGREILLDADTKIQILWSPPENFFSKRAQDNGLVLMIHLGKYKILWAGDISGEVEQFILSRNLDIRADALVQGQNLKQKNLSRKWLEAVKPTYLIRPSQKYAPDFSLDDDFRNILKDLNISFLDMSKTGAVEIEAKLKNLVVNTFKQN